MPTPRDPAVTEYVRMRVRELQKELSGEAIAKKVGVSPSLISSLWKTGVGGRSIDGFARLLSFSDANELRRTAYAWWSSQQGRTETRADEPAVKAALESVRGLHPNLSDEQLRTILHRFADEAFDGRDEEYWLRTLLEEVKQDYLRAQRERTQRAERTRDKSKAIADRQALFRTGHNLRNAAEQERRVAEIEAPPSSGEDPDDDPISVPTETQIRPPGRRRQKSA